MSSLGMGCGEIGNSELGLLDLYSRVKLRTSSANVCRNRRSQLVEGHIKPLNDASKTLRAWDGLKLNSKKTTGQMHVTDTGELVTSGDDCKFDVRSAKMLSLLSIIKKEALVLSRRADLLVSREKIDNEQVKEECAASMHCPSDLTLDENVAVEMLDILKKSRSKTLKYGDMVWGKIKSFPWWPGEIYNEAFASPRVRNTKKEGYVLVAFYGDATFGWLDPIDVIPFNSHYIKKSKQTNTLLFLTAVEEAVNEVHKRAALSLVCNCWKPNNFRPTCVQGFVEVDVRGYESRGVYSTEQIERARDEFVPSELLSFVKQVALGPMNGMLTNVDCMKNMAKVLAYWKASFEKFDKEYDEAFMPLSNFEGSTVCSDGQKKTLAQGARG